MSDDLYDRDILAWSEHQADLLRRVGQGERVNDLDWANLAEEIEAVGRSEFHSVESFLTLMLEHLVRLQTWPDDQACNHWRGEIATFQIGANKRFTPAMRRKIDLRLLYADALRRMKAEAPNTSFPADNSLTLENLLNDDVDHLLGE